MAKRKETECAVGNRQDEEEILKTYQTEDYDYLANSATGMDCTGLMHRTPSNENEMGVQGIVEKNEQTNETAEVLVDIVKENKQNAESIQTIVSRFSK